MRTIQRGLDERQEQDPSLLIRDTRTMGQRIADFLTNPLAVTVTLTAMGISAYFLPGFADLILIIGICIFIYTSTRRNTLPFRLPLASGIKDYNDLKPGTNKPNEARGIYFFGNERKTREELWFNNEDMRTHVLMFGSTGSGKTESMISLAYNALLQSSGFIYVDGKGDNSLFAKIFSMVRYMGRDDDMLLINFMTGARDIVGPQKKRLSNTLNPFAVGSSSMLSQLVVSLMDSSAQGSSDADMWKGRAIAFVEAIMKILVAMRDAGHILLDANAIRNYFLIDRIEAMVMDKAFVRDGQETISLEGLPDVVMEPIKNYLFNLPGYNKAKKGKQVSQVLEQHGFITMQLTRVFSSLADTYGHIMRTKLAEVDLKDVVLNRRILAALLPAMEKSPDELANLGKIIIASLRAMMAAGLGDEVEGEFRDLVQRKPTNAPSPYLCILDEYGYYAVQGFAVVPAQARSLGFSVVFAGQDLPAFQRASKEEAASIGANCNIKICMKLEDPIETWEFFAKTAGESYVTHVGGFQAEAKNLTNNYLDTRSAQLEKRARIDLLDMKDQGLGEATIFFKSKIVRASMFFADPPVVKKMRLNHFLKVDKPDDMYINQLIQAFESIEKLNPDEEVFAGIAVQDSGDLTRVLTKMVEDKEVPPIERGVSALLAYHEQITPEEKEEEIESGLPPLEVGEGELNIFVRIHLSDYLREHLLTEDIENFGKPLLGQSATRDQALYVERLMGKSEQHSATISKEIVKDMQVATKYPPELLYKPAGPELAKMVDDVIAHIAMRKKEVD